MKRSAYTYWYCDILVAGWSGEVGNCFEQTILVLAKRDSNQWLFERKISPLINTEKKGSAFLMLLQQYFRKAVAIKNMRGNAMLKMSRLHYVRGRGAPQRSQENIPSEHEQQ